MGLMKWLQTRRMLKEIELKSWSHHQEMMETAAGLSTVMVRCHRHTWEIAERGIERLSSDREHWTSPEPEDAPDREDLIQVRLSGPQLVAVIDALSITADIPYHRTGYVISSAERAIARRIYKEIAAVLEQVNDTERPTTTALPAIVIDDPSGTAHQPG